MGISIGRAVKLAVLALLAPAMIGSIVARIPDLSSGWGSLASLLLGLLAVMWLLVRTFRDGGGFVSVGHGLLTGVSRAERRVLRRARRRPEQVPEHLAALAAGYAREQAESNDRLGWLMVALILLGAPAQDDYLPDPPLGAVAYIVFLVAVGLAADRLGQLWYRAERTQQQRLASRFDQQWTPRAG